MAQTAKSVAQMSNDQPEKPGKIIAQIIRKRREELRIGQKELAGMIGMHPQTMNKIERGEIDHSRFFYKIEQALKMPDGIISRQRSSFLMDAAVRDYLESNVNGAATHKPLDDNLTQMKGDFLGPVDMPLYAAVVEVGEDFMRVSAQPVGLTARPANLKGVRDAYAMVVPSDSMAPAYEAGDEIWMNPHLPPVNHKDVLLRRAADGADFFGAILGRYVGQTATHWLVVEHNTKHKRDPRKVLRREYPNCHRVVGAYNA